MEDVHESIANHLKNKIFVDLKTKITNESGDIIGVIDQVQLT